MNSIEVLRKDVVDELMNLGTMKKVWPIWKPQINLILNSDNPVESQQLRALGNQLYDIFKSSSSGERGQDDVSAGGTAWEALVCWYLNLCLAGSRTVVIKAKKKHIPTPISDSITVMYGSSPSNTESDLLAITFPSEAESSPYSGSITELNAKLSSLITNKFAETELTVIQCKTNWNDNAQIPMLWDLIYSSTGFNNSAVSVGKNGFISSGLKKFTYAFATVPTVDPSKIKNTSTCVLRVRNISGGNYWGRASKPAVAMNLFEMINRNFQTSLTSYIGGWNAAIGQIVSDQIDNNNYFKI